MFAFIVIDHLGRAYQPIQGFIAQRYPRVPINGYLKHDEFDGQPPRPRKPIVLACLYCINWDISPDGKTLYAVPMEGNQLFSYDLTAAGDTLPAKITCPLRMISRLHDGNQDRLPGQVRRPDRRSLDRD